jgi:hypothetical protein
MPLSYRSTDSTRRPMAVGIWTLQAISLPLVPAQNAIAAAAIQLVVSLTALTATMLAAPVKTDGKSPFRQQRLSTGISLVICLAWAWKLSENQSNPIIAFLATMAVSPIVLAFIMNNANANSRSGMHAPAIADASDSLQPPATDLPSHKGRNPSTQRVPSTHAVTDVAAATIAPTLKCTQPLAAATTKSPTQRDPQHASWITQWQQRSLLGDGDVIEGGVRVNFKDEQREATVHVSFCPPFQGIPEISTEQIDSDNLEIRAAAVFPFGARLTIRRRTIPGDNGCLPGKESYLIKFVAISRPTRRAA